MPPVPPAAQDPYPGRRADRDLRLAKPRPELSRQNEARAPPGRVYTFDTLCEKGISFSKNHIRRLVAAGGFPPPFYMSERRPAWSEAALDEWIAHRQAAAGGDEAKQRKRRENARAAALAKAEKKKRGLAP